MSRIGDLVRGRRGVISAATLAVVVAVPVIIAVTHQGFPVSTAELDPKTVWVTNRFDSLAGRLNRPIEELNAAVSFTGVDNVVHQDGPTVLLHDVEEGLLSRIDPAFTVVEGGIDVGPGTVSSFGGGIVALVDVNGDLRIIRADQTLESPGDPVAELGRGGLAAVSPSGVVFGYSPAQGTLVTMESPGAEPQVSDVASPGEDLELTTVGDQPVLLALGTTSLVLPGGDTYELPDIGLRLQQPGPDADTVLVATKDGLLEVPLGGGAARELPADPERDAEVPSDVAAPVRLGSCIYGAWATGGQVLRQCGGDDPIVDEVSEPTTGDELIFRVNRTVIVLNNVDTGDSFLMDDGLTLVANWDDVKPEEEKSDTTGDEVVSEDTFEDQAATRKDTNTTPVANEDVLGARPSTAVAPTATVLPVVDNDTDSDGDVLTITRVDPNDESVGLFEIVDGGRALQFTPVAGFEGSPTAQYTISDGRKEGVASASVTVVVSSTNQGEPEQQRITSINVEQGQSMTYNALGDWLDPDGDPVFLKSAVAGGDRVSHTPDGLVTFAHVTGETGQKTVEVVVSDGELDAPGTLVFNVHPAGSLTPVAVPDFATTFVGQPVSVPLLANDRSPSGEPLKLISAEVLTDQGASEGSAPTVVAANGTITATQNLPGDYYFRYTVGAGSQVTVGIVRVHVEEDPEAPLPPIAVSDIAYLRPGQSVDLGVLQNDSSPSGRVIGVQSVALDASVTGVSVEILKNTLLRLSTSTALEGQSAINFTYTISDGVTDPVTAGVTVVPLPPDLTGQSPIAKDDDGIVVRAGDFVDVDVLDNDLHPNGSIMQVQPEFVEPLAEGAGFAFVQGDQVRYQAPETPGTYRLVYSVVDPQGLNAAAAVNFTVVPVDQDNFAPVPRDIEARLFAGASFVIEVPTSGVDAEGDSTTLLDISAAPALGRVVDQGHDWIRYEAFSDATGTDAFTYQVVDSFGAVGQATVRIGVLPVPDEVQPPSAINDIISIRPERTGTVPVLANDSDPSGFPLALEELGKYLPDIEAEIIDSQIAITASAVEGVYSVPYTISNGHGGLATGYVTVYVDVDAPLLPPVAFDHVIDVQDVAGESTIDVDVLDDALNPGGLVDELEVGVVGPGAGFAAVQPDSAVQVTLGDTRRVVAFTLTNADGLTATAFIVVPRRVSGDYAPPPYLRPDLGEQTVRSGEERTWNLADILVVPSGRAATITSEDLVTATRSDGSSSAVDDDTIRFQSEEGYGGPASITFQVTDGASAEDGNTAFVTLPITVIGAEPPKVPPVFVTQTLEVEVGKSADLDLRAATDHPDPATKAQFTYDDMREVNPPGTIHTRLVSGILTAEADGGSVGDTMDVTFRISGGGVDSAVGTVRIVVVGSTKQDVEAHDDYLETQRPRTETVYPLINDLNPYAAEGHPLTIISAVVENGSSLGFSDPVINSDGSAFTVVPPSDFVGRVSVFYTVQDYSGEVSRQRDARYVLLYRDVPGNDASADAVTFGDQQLTGTVSGPATPNESPISHYEVSLFVAASSSLVATRNCALREACTFTNLTNGVEYRFSGRAVNAIGPGDPFPMGLGTPYRAPSPPILTASNDNTYGYMYWTIPNDGSGGVKAFEWRIPGVTSGTADAYGGQPVAVPFSTAGGPYYFEARSWNPGGWSAWAASGSFTIPQYLTFSGVATTVNDVNFPGETPDDGRRVYVNYTTNVPAGQYEICATSTFRVRWWHTYASPGRNVFTAADGRLRHAHRRRTRQPPEPALRVGSPQRPYGAVRQHHHVHHPRRLPAHQHPEPMTPTQKEAPMALKDEQAQWFAEAAQKLVENIEHAVLGKRDVVRLVLASMLSNGHVLLEDAPGTGKTLLAKSLAATLDGTTSRIQFTPDLLPSDVTGRVDLRPGQGQVRVPSGADLRDHRARRRDQPREPEDAVGVARGDGGGARHGRR